MRGIKHILTVTGILFAAMLFGQQTGYETVKQKVLSFLKSENLSETHSPTEIKTLFSDNQNLPESYLVSLFPRGFVVVSSINDKYPVLAWSADHNFISDENENYITALALLEEVVSVDINDVRQGVYKNTKNVNELYGPYVHTMWGQVNCRDANGVLINVTNIFTPEHYAAGCVAISQATVLHHYRWPPKGVGSYSYSDNSGSSHGTYSVNFGEKEYRWDLMLERYRSKISTVEQREAAGELAYDCAVSLHMNFEPNGSTSNVNRIPSAIAQHFRFTALYRARSSSTFWNLLDNNMINKKPAVLAIENSSGGGHSVVCDGLKIDENGTFYHLNMGWWGASNGWYKIRGTFDAGGYSHVLGAAMNIIPEPMIIPPVIDADSIEFDLVWRYPEKAEAEAFQVQKKVDDGDWMDITTTTTDTVLHLLVDPEKEYQFRVRAKTNGIWYQNSWSTVEKLKRTYVSIPETEKNTVKFYPNPVSETLTLDFDKQFNGTVTVYSATGKEFFFEKYFSVNKTVINVNDWEQGIYFIKISGNSFHSIKKIIKKQ